MTLSGNPSRHPHIRVNDKCRKLVLADLGDAEKTRYKLRDFASSTALAGAIILKDELLAAKAISKEQCEALTKLKEKILDGREEAEN